jgi:hypothetical protein
MSGTGLCLLIHTGFVWMVCICKFLCKWNHYYMHGYFLEIKGYLEHVNTSHIHDLAKFMFGLCFLDLPLVFTIYVDMVCKYS